MADIQDFDAKGGDGRRDYLDWLERLERKAKIMAVGRGHQNWVPIYNNLVAAYDNYITLVAPDTSVPSNVVTNLGESVTHLGEFVTNG